MVSLVLGLSGAVAAVAVAAPPRVSFDLPPLASSRDVTPEEFAAANPNERWIEVRFPLSVFLTGNESELTEIQAELHLETPHAQIVDYSPKTALTDRYTGSVEVQQIAESSRGAGLTVSGAEANVKATGSAEAAQKNAKTVKYQEIPAKEIVTAAGTLRRGQGVYFKLRPTAATTVQGSHELSAIVRVPKSWRGDVLYVACEARALRESSGFPAAPFEKEPAPFSAGSGRFQVALYLEGDQKAWRAALQFADADAELRSKMNDADRHVAAKVRPDLLHRIGNALDLTEPRLPADWRATLLASPEQVKQTSFRNALPPELVEAGEIYWLAKDELVRLR
jgi:hypothetical protein